MTLLGEVGYLAAFLRYIHTHSLFLPSTLPPNTSPPPTNPHTFPEVRVNIRELILFSFLFFSLAGREEMFGGPEGRGGREGNS